MSKKQMLISYTLTSETYKLALNTSGTIDVMGSVFWKDLEEPLAPSLRSMHFEHFMNIVRGISNTEKNKSQNAPPFGFTKETET